MRFLKSLGGVLLVGVLVAACGGSTPTQAPGGATQAPGAATQDPGGGGGGGATPEPQATEDNGGGGGGGGGGGIDTTYGKVHIEISGTLEKTADFGFIPAASIFGGPQGSTLTFSNTAGDELVSIVVTAEGAVLVTYGGLDMSVPSSECTTSNWNLGATSGSGSFDCTATIAMTASGAIVSGVKVKGNFDARV